MRELVESGKLKVVGFLDLLHGGILFFVGEIVHRETQRRHRVAQSIIYFFLSVSSCFLRALRERISHRETRRLHRDNTFLKSLFIQYFNTIRMVLCRSYGACITQSVLMLLLFRSYGLGFYQLFSYYAHSYAP
jgi:hypothetical protein